MIPSRWLIRIAGLAVVFPIGFALSLLCAAGDGRPAPLPPTPATPTSVRSPIVWFRQLLDATAADLERALQSRPESQRRWLVAKLEEYRALPSGERELRLRATELQWYLRPLLAAPATNRPTLLARVPREYRPIIDQRLQNWDALPPDTRNDLLHYESAAAWVLRSNTPARSSDTLLPTETSSTRRRELERRLSEWQTLPEDRRQRVCDLFQRFFELSPREKQKTLNTFDDAERREIESMLRAFEKLPPAERLLCLRSFQRFAQLTPQERAGFLQSADRWRELSPADREVWRRLVQRLPPMPPGLMSPPRPPLPPVPSRAGPALPPSPTLATNRQSP